MDRDRSTHVPERLRFEAIGSSNDVILNLARQDVAEHTTVTAERMTQARAGAGVWHAPPGGLWMSTLWRPHLGFDVAPCLALAAAWGVREGIRKATGIAPGITWPNDLTLEGEKVGSVMVEGRIVDEQISLAAVGVGVNVNNPVAELPDPLPETACSLMGVRGDEVDLEALTVSVQAALEDARVLVDDLDALVGRVSSCWTQKGARVSVDAGHTLIEGRAVGLTPHGGLELETEEGAQVVQASGASTFVRIVDTS